MTGFGDGPNNEGRLVPHPAPGHMDAAQPAPATPGPLFKGRQVADGGGLRKDDGKNKLDLIPPEWIWALGAVLTQGAEKYAVRNWERGMAWSKMIGCGLRHVFKFVCGERYDPESGCHHLAHAAWNFLALMTYDIRKIGENDLPNFDDAVALAYLEGIMDPGHPRTKRIMALARARIEEARK